MLILMENEEKDTFPYHKKNVITTDPDKFPYQLTKESNPSYYQGSHTN